MIKKFRYYVFIMIVIIASVVFTGCWDYKDLNEKNIIIGLGVDIEDKNIIFTGEVSKSNYRIGNGQEGEKTEKGTYTYTGKGSDFEKARLDYDYKSSFEEFYGGLRTLVFSEKYVKERGIETYLNRFNLSKNYRKSVSICISREPCNELFNKKLKTNISVGLDIDDTLRSLSYEGEGVYIQVGEVISNINDKNIGYVIPYIGEENGAIMLLGYAVMKDDKLIDIIPANQSQAIVYLLCKKPNLKLSTSESSDPDNKVSYENLLKNRKIKTYYDDNIPIINVDVNIKSTLNYKYIRRSISKEEIRLIQHKIEEDAKNEIYNMIEKSQKQYKQDILGFGKYFKGQNYSIYKKIDWEKEYLKAKMNVSVKAKIIDMNLNDPNAEVKN